MELTHKNFFLVNPKGESVTIENIDDLRIMIEGWDFSIPVKAKDEKDKNFFLEPELVESGIEGFSIFSKLDVDKNGYLVFKDMHFSFYDIKSKTELLVKEIADPSFFSTKAFNHILSDEQVQDLMDALTSYYKKAIEEGEKEAQEESGKNKPEILEGENAAPVVETPVVETPAPVVETPVVETPVVETPAPVVETPIADQNAKQLEENAIPQAVLDEYAQAKSELEAQGYKEAAYKNYRFIYNPDSEGKDVFLLLLTTSALMEITKLTLFDDEQGDKYKYRFTLDGEKKSLYFDKKTSEIVVKKAKKSEDKSPEIKDEVKEEEKKSAEDETKIPKTETASETHAAQTK